MGYTDWTSGFFPALLWQMYLYSEDPDFLGWATSWSSELSTAATITSTHDLGFMVGVPARLALEATADPSYASTIVTAATSLASRYDADVGAIRSWDFGGWNYPVIVDNLMNLELLHLGADHTGVPGDASAWEAIARSHANVSSAEHIRGDGSTYHLVDFDDADGSVISKGTHAGAADESTWARGQAWAIHGLTTEARETGDASLLAHAIDVADYFLGNLPPDSVPYWDFEEPTIPSTERDTSAAAIAASGLLELSTLTGGADSARYFDGAMAILDSLMTSTYLSDGVASEGILLHGVGNRPVASEVDVSLIYADYYFVEALLRYLAIA